jgi:succinate dehydrogenase (ubiquinone) cytochrome b560 subunit
MKNTGRPVSPHVTIYNFPIAALASITNRVTGCALSFGCLGVGALELLGGTGTTAFVMDTIGSSGFLVASGAKFGVGFTVLYHYLGAVRHFSWDYMPEMLTNVDVEKSSWYLFGGSTLLATGLVFM